MRYLMKIDISINNFCHKNNLNAGHMCQVLKENEKHHKGWRIFKIKDSNVNNKF